MSTRRPRAAFRTVTSLASLALATLAPGSSLAQTASPGGAALPAVGAQAPGALPAGAQPAVGAQQPGQAADPAQAQVPSAQQIQSQGQAQIAAQAQAGAQGGAVVAIPNDGTEVITLADVVAIARRDPPTVLLAAARARAAEAQVAIARTALMPSVVASAGLNGVFSAGPIVSRDGIMSGMAGSQVNLSAWVDGSVSARWTIWDFGRTANNVEAATLNARGARLDLASQVRLAVSQAASAYFVVLADEDLLEAIGETVRQRERQLGVARGLVAAGTRAPIEQVRAEVALDAARLDLSVADATLQNDAVALGTALALDPSIRRRVRRPRVGPVDDDPIRAANAAQAARPELAAARARVEQAEASLAAARAAYLPTLSASGSASIRYTERVGAPMGALSETGNAGVTLSVPIFDPVISANVRLAEANLAAARAVVAQQVLVARTEAAQAAIALRTARQQLAQSERLAAGAAANLAQAEGRYAAGAAPLLELIDAQAADAQARTALVRARVQVDLAVVRLFAATGSLGQLENAQ